MDTRQSEFEIIINENVRGVIHSWIGYTTSISNEEAEIVAFYNALKHALHWKTTAIYIEDDAKIVINAFNTKEWKLMDLNT